MAEDGDAAPGAGVVGGTPEESLRAVALVLVSAFTGAAGVNLTEVLLRGWSVPALGIAMPSNVVGGLFLLGAAALQRTGGWRGWPAADWLRLGAAALAIYALGFLLLYTAIDLAGSSLTILLGRLETLFVVALAVLFLGERWTLRHWGASLLAVGGAVLVTLDPDAVHLHLGLGEALALAGAFVIAAGIVVLKSLVDRQDGQVVTGYGLLLGAVLLAPFALGDAAVRSAAIAGGAPVAGILLLRGVLLGISWVTYNVAMRHIGASRSAVLFLTVVVFTVGLQLVVHAVAPQLGVRLPGSWLAAGLGGALIGIAVVLLHREG